MVCVEKALENNSGHDIVLAGKQHMYLILLKIKTLIVKYKETKLLGLVKFYNITMYI